MERTTTSTPLDLNPAEKSGEIISFDAAKALNLEAIETLRSAQLATYKLAKDIYQNLGFTGEKLKQYTHGPVLRKVDEYLAAQGLSSDDPRYDEYKAAFDDLSVTSSYASSWEKSAENPGESGQEKAEKYYRKFVDGVDDEDVVEDDEALVEVDPILVEKNTAPAADIDPAVEAARQHLDTLRDTVATLSAKRQGRIFGTGGKKYEDAVRAYNEQVIKLGKLEKQSLIDDENVTEAAKKAEVVAYLLKEQNDLRELSMEKLKGTAVHKFVEMMNKGNVAQRIGKGILFGAGVSIVAAGAGALIGAAGATVIVGGATAGIIGAGRFARGFARSDAKKGRGMQTLDDIKHYEGGQNTDTYDSSEYFEEIHKHYADKFEADTDKEQKKRLKSVGAGVLGIALGTGAGVALQAVADAGIFDGFMNRGLSLPFGGNQVHAEAPDTTSPDIGTNPADHIDASPNPADTSDTGVQPTQPEVSYDPGFSIGDGEGGIQFFQELGLTEANWYEVHQELLQQFPGDFYSMNGGVDVGLAHPGQLSLGAQEFIKAKFNLA